MDKENEKSRDRAELLNSLVDIRDVKLDAAAPIQERMRSYVEQIRDPYRFKVGNVIVRVSYANTHDDDQRQLCQFDCKSVALASITIRLWARETGVCLWSVLS